LLGLLRIREKREERGKKQEAREKKQEAREKRKGFIF
jgi:hypothetical protein